MVSAMEKREAGRGTGEHQGWGRWRSDVDSSAPTPGTSQGHRDTSFSLTVSPPQVSQVTGSCQLYL